MIEKPLVTIVTPVYKGADYIDELILSVRNQSYPNIEHLIIDDGSPDDGKTIAVLQRHPHLRWWSRPNIGQYGTLNEGFHAAKGDWVTTISHDDRLSDNGSIEALVAHAATHPDADLVHGITRYIDREGNPLPIQGRQKYPYWVLQYSLFVTHCSMIVRASKLKEHGLYFDESLRFVGDADWIMRMQLAGLKFSLLDRVICDYRQHPAQVTNDRKADDKGYAAWAKERDLLETRYGKNRALRFLVKNWVTYERRKRVLADLIRRRVRGTRS